MSFAGAPIWVTEIGMTATPNAADQDPSAEEQAQADFLSGVYHAVLDAPDVRAAVHSVFWFKYEDFPAPHPAVPFGVVRLAETATGYAPSGAVTVHKLAYRAYQAVALPGGLPESRLIRQAGIGDPYFFAAACQAIAPEFQQYWTSKGGLAQFGYPLTQPNWQTTGGLPVYGYPLSEEVQDVNPRDGQTYTVQYFERNRIEYHPENTGTPYEMELGLLGGDLLLRGLWWR